MTNTQKHTQVYTDINQFSHQLTTKHVQIKVSAKIYTDTDSNHKAPRVFKDLLNTVSFTTVLNTVSFVTELYPSQQC